MAWHTDSSGQWILVAHVPVEQQLAHYRNNPPSCLTGLRCTVTDLPGYVFDGHGEPVNAIFAVACPCGGDVFQPFGWSYEDGPEGTRPPFHLECAECEADWKVFDPARDGFDAVVSGVRAVEPDSLIEFVSEYQIFVRFEYASDVLGDPDHPQFRGSEHDMFTWYTLVGRDVDTGKLVTLAEEECA